MEKSTLPIEIQEHETNYLTLSDGRTLCYADYGDPKGKPLFYQPGWPSSRLDGARLSPLASELGLRVISVDRFGLGGSTYSDEITIGSYPQDMLELAEHLGWDKFGVMGVSGGGPYAYACAVKIPVQKLYFVSSVAGFGDWTLKRYIKNKTVLRTFNTVDRMPFMYQFMHHFMFGKYYKNWEIEKFEKSLTKMISSMDEYSRAYYQNNPDGVRLLARALALTGQQGGKTVTKTGRLYVQPWDFDVADIPEELKVLVFHGQEDENCPIEMAEAIVKEIKNVEMHTFPETAHGDMLKHLRTILETLSKHYNN